MPPQLPSEFDPERPLPAAHTIPASWYFSKAVADAERETVFLDSWQCVGRAEQLSNPGDYLTAYLAGGEPVCVVRGDDGELRAFFNVCRHRAAEILAEPSGNVTKLRCRYHGWTYDLAGRLRGVPEFNGVEGFCKEEQGLVPLGGVVVALGQVWIHVKPPRQSWEAMFAPVRSWADTVLPFSGLIHVAHREFTVRCNWKVYVDNYLDGGYHVNTVHPGLAGVLNYQHYSTTLYDHASLQSAPLQPGEGEVGRTRTGERASYWWLWPNFMLNHYDGVIDTNIVTPLDEQNCRVLFNFYFTPDKSEEFISESIRTAEEVQMEDCIICESVQRGLASRSYTVGRYSAEREAGGHHFHRLLHTAIHSDFEKPTK